MCPLQNQIRIRINLVGNCLEILYIRSYTEISILPTSKKNQNKQECIQCSTMCTVCCSGHLRRGECLPRGVVCPGGVCPGGVCPGGVCPGGVCLGGVYPGGCTHPRTQRQTPPHEQNDCCGR